MGLLDVLFGRPKRRRRRRSTRPTAARQQRERLEAQQRDRRDLDREAARWLAADDRRRRQERERGERQGIRQREREQRREARLMERAQKARDRAVEAYITHGLTRAEAEQMVDREPDWTSYDFNPRRRNVRGRSWPSRRTNPAGGLSARGERLLLDIEAGAIPPVDLYDGLPARSGGRIRVRKRGGRYSVTHEYGGRLPPMRMATDVDESRARDAAHRLYGQTLAHDYDALFRQIRRKRNPGLAAVVGEIAKDVVKGAAVATAQEELKEWRNRRGGLGIVRRAPRRNPARREPNHADPKLREMSERFHGRPDQILHLDEDQRRPPPKHVVLIGQERATVYRTPRSSERAGSDWEHEAGDRGGLFRRNASGRRLLVADEHGRVYLLQGSSSMRFDPDRGLVG